MWFERVAELESREVARLRDDVLSLAHSTRRSGRLGPHSRVIAKRFWARENTTSTRFYKFEPSSYDNRLREYPALLSFLSMVELDSNLPFNEVQININHFEAHDGSRTGWHKDSRSNGRSKVHVATVDGRGELLYRKGLKIVREPLEVGSVCVFHNEISRRRHNVLNGGDGERLSIVAWQPTQKRYLAL